MPLWSPSPPRARAVNSCPVAGIGASAGGLEAVTQLLHAMPADTGAALVLVQHLAPGRPSSLREILSRATAMPVCEVQDEVEVEPNHVYVIPPGKNMIIAAGRLSLQPRRGTGIQHPIDEFLTSLAEDQGHRAIGVILSGTATDGTLGVKEIKAAGGVTFAQDASAQQDSMPRSAIATGCVDFVLPPDKIAEEIARIATHPYVAPAPVSSDTPQPEPAEPEQDQEDEAGFGEILQLLHDAKNVDFSQYKPNTLRRRIARRMLLQNRQTAQEYQQFLASNPAEVEALFQDILIGVTRFFRDPAIFDALKADVLPKLFTVRSQRDPLRIWVLGCSSGEEAYSYAIALAEFAETAPKPVPVQVFATDLNAIAIDTARAGIYPKSIEQDLSQERLRRYFAEFNGSYRVSKSIRDMCVFARHNVLSDPPFSRMDIVSCRNLLIYLDSALQQKVLPLLHYALRPDGVLVLGGSETIGMYRGLFHPLDSKHRIYARLPGRETPSFAQLQTAPRRTGAEWHTLPKIAQPHSSVVQKEADRILLSRFAPPGVVINANLEIVQFRGDTSRWLAPPQGKPSLNLAKMMREGLVPALPAAINKAGRDNAAVREQGLRVRSAGGWCETAIEVIPVHGEGENDAAFLILFQDGAGAVAGPQPGPLPSASPGDPGSNDGANAAQLMQELGAMREYLQSVIEQQEAANEELQSASEEAQSANEELQSVNEELETSKEEIQASNEELATVNDELQHRNQELDRAREFAENMIASVRDPLLVVDENLRVQSASRSYYQTFRVRPEETLQRPIYDLSNGQWNIPALRSALEEVVSHDKAFDAFEVRHDFAYLGRRIMLLNARRLLQEPGRQLLILVSIEDITESHALQESRQKLALMEDNERRKNEFLAMLAHELRNPLAPLRTGLQLLKDSRVDAERTVRVREIMERQIGAMTRLIDDLLDTARIAQGKIELRREPIDLNVVLIRAANLAQVYFDAREQEFNLSLPSQPVFMEADATRLEQLFGNLLHNASKFTPPRGRISLDAAVQGDPIDPDASHQVRVSVRDNGVGIDSDTLPRVFELFTQAERSLERTQGGLGIGLTLARKLAELHGGTLEGFSAGPGQGSEFVVRLPITDKPPEQPLAPAAEEQPHAVRRVLIVDDNADTAQSLEMALTLAGHSTKVAHDGAAAIESALEFRPEIVLCDIGLPRMSGYEVARTLRRTPETAQVMLVAITGYGKEEDRRLAREAGFDHHLTKPVDLEKLWRIFDTLPAQSETN